MLLPLYSGAAIASQFGRFGQNRRGSTVVEFALVAPIFFALLFALFETALVFFAGQVLENGLQDSGRLIYTAQAQDASMTQTKFKDELCKRLDVLFTCANVSVDVKSYAQDDIIPAATPYDGAGIPMGWDLPPAGSTRTVVVKAFYQWPLFVTQLGYNIANINRDKADSKRLLIATSAFRVEPR